MDNIGNDEWLSLPTSEHQLNEWISRNTDHPAMKLADLAMKMKRSPNQVFVLLIGLTGAGKISTVDHLFGTNIGETKPLQPEERSTIEYTVKLKSTRYRIPDLQLSIIDTPGLCDTKGLEQDAKNIMSVKYFLESNLYIRNRYPNLVMVILDINDNRFTGLSSSFAKMLIGINNTNTIDSINPNVVIVLTHAMGIARNPIVWEEKVELMKSQYRAMVRDYLGINPEIVVLENKPENYNLERDGDCYLLPNGDKQPQNLYQACERMFVNAKDEIGHEAVGICFRSDIDKSVKTVNTISSSSVKTEDVQAMHILLFNTAEISSTSEVYCKLENYKNQTLAKELVNDMNHLQTRLRSLGISKLCDLEGMTINALLKKMSPTKINKEMQKVLEEIFGLSNEPRKSLNYHIEISKRPNQYHDDDSFAQENPYQILHPPATSKTCSWCSWCSWCSCGSCGSCCSCYPCCFHEDSLVMLQNQKQKRMKNISIGDKILTADSHGRLIQDEIIAWLHQERDGQFTFLQIVHNHGKITLSPDHIMFVGNTRDPKHASTLSPGDELFIVTEENDHQKETFAVVLSIRTVTGRGIYAPLTYSGRLLVDSVDVSCYSYINSLQIVGKEIISSHALAHVGFLPLRIAYKLGFNISYSEFDDGTGIHGYARWLMRIVMRK